MQRQPGDKREGPDPHVLHPVQGRGRARARLPRLRRLPLQEERQVQGIQTFPVPLRQDSQSQEESQKTKSEAKVKADAGFRGFQYHPPNDSNWLNQGHTQRLFPK